MRIYCVVLLLLILYLSIMPFPLLAENSGDTGVSESISVETPIPGHMCYKGCSFALEAVIHNGLGESVNISIGTMFESFTAKWSNYSSAELDPGESIVYSWILWAPRNISYGNYTLGLNITYTANSTVYSIYRETWIEIIPRNVSLLTTDLFRNATGYYLVVGNPVIDPGQYIVENITVTLTAL